MCCRALPRLICSTALQRVGLLIIGALRVIYGGEGLRVFYTGQPVFWLKVGLFALAGCCRCRRRFASFAGHAPCGQTGALARRRRVADHAQADSVGAARALRRDDLRGADGGGIGH